MSSSKKLRDRCYRKSVACENPLHSSGLSLLRGDLSPDMKTRTQADLPPECLNLRKQTAAVRHFPQGYIKNLPVVGVLPHLDLVSVVKRYGDHINRKWKVT